MSIFALALSLALSASQEAPGASWALNLDFGDGPVAREVEGGEGLEPGFWNAIRFHATSTWSLLDSEGRATGVRVHATGAASWVICVEQNPYPDLTMDGVHSVGEDQTYRFLDLPAGVYALLVYARPHGQAQATGIQVEMGEPRFVCFERDTTGSKPQASWHFVRHLGGACELTLMAASEKSETRLEAIQWIRLSTELLPSATQVLHVGKLACVVGVESMQGEFQGWMRGFAGGAAPLACLRLGGISSGATPFPEPIEAATLETVSYDRQPLAQGLARWPAVEAAGVSRWVELWSRDEAGRGWTTRSRWLTWNG